MGCANGIAKAFPCEQCGCCCRSLAGCEIYADLNRGDGICRYLDTSSNLCTIYERRPDKCNIIRMYLLFFAKQYTWENFIDINKQACHLLRLKFKQKVSIKGR